MSHMMISKTCRRGWPTPFVAAAGLVLAGCGGVVGGGGGDATCEGFPSEEIEYIVPYAAGGGFDAWARLMAPYLEDELGVPVRVSNIDGGGGMRAMNQINAAPPDGTSIVFTEPGFVSVNQVLGETTEDFDIRTLTYLGQATIDPQIFAVASNSDVSSLSDLSGSSVHHAAQDISPIETITYDSFDIDGEYIIHESTSETFLAIERGDLDITVTSLSSIVEYLEPTGNLKPVLFIGTEEINGDMLGYDKLKDVETIDEAGRPELAEALEQYRVIAAPPELPACMADTLSSAVAAVLENEEFIQEAERAQLRVIPDDAESTQQRVSETYATFEEYSDVLEQARSG